MGSQSMMTRSLATVANFVFKLHIAALSAPHVNLTLYPMNDGMFAVADRLPDIQRWLTTTFRLVKMANASAKGDFTKIFLTRASIAFGPLVEGRNLNVDASQVLANNQQVRDRILIGAPVVNAYAHERQVSPFGIFVHESARTFAPTGIQPWSIGSYMRYWPQGAKPAWVFRIQNGVKYYLDHCKGHSNELGYSIEDIERHESLSREFFDY
jgi:hypothetical protein